MIHIGLNSGNVIGVRLISQSPLQALDAYRDGARVERFKLVGEDGFTVGIVQRSQVSYIVDVDTLGDEETFLTIVDADIASDEWS